MNASVYMQLWVSRAGGGGLLTEKLIRRERVYVIEYAPAQAQEYPSDIRQFSLLRVLQKIHLRIINIMASISVVGNYGRIQFFSYDKMTQAL